MANRLKRRWQSLAWKTKLIMTAAAAAAVVMGIIVAMTLRGDRVPSENKMAQMMADIYLADAALQDYVIKGKDDKTAEELYHTILSHYGLTKAEYDSALVYYAASPQKMSSVYDRCIAILSSREAMIREATEKNDSTQKLIEHINDSIRVLIGACPTMMKLPMTQKGDTLLNYVGGVGAGADTALEFTAKIDSIRGGYLTMKEKYTFGRDNKAAAAAMWMRVLYADSTTEEAMVELEIGKKVTQKEASMTIILPDTVAAVGVTYRPIESAEYSKLGVTLREAKVYHMPYDAADSVENVIEFPSLFTY